MKIAHINGDRVFTRGTIVIYPPTKDALIEMIRYNINRLYLKVGATFVHPKENYNKKVGVARADTLALNESSKYCLLTKIEPREDKFVYHFTVTVPDPRPKTCNYAMVEFGLSISGKSTEPSLVYACFKE